MTTVKDGILGEPLPNRETPCDWARFARGQTCLATRELPSSVARSDCVTMLSVSQLFSREISIPSFFARSVILSLCMPPVTTTKVIERSDEELIVAYRNGDASCFRTLLERYRLDLWHFLVRLTGSRAAADDVFQEAFLQVHLSADSFDAERRFKPWLFTIAANKGRDFLRRQHRRAATSLSTPLSRDGDGTLGDLMASDTPLPSAPMVNEQDRSAVTRVVDALPTHYREILVLAYFQKMSYEQISQTLEIPLGTVKSRLHAAVASFSDGYKRANATEVMK